MRQCSPPPGARQPRARGQAGNRPFIGVGLDITLGVPANPTYLGSSSTISSPDSQSPWPPPSSPSCPTDQAFKPLSESLNCNLDPKGSDISSFCRVLIQ